MTNYESIRSKARTRAADWTICQNWREFRAYISAASEDHWGERDNGLASLPDFCLGDEILDQSNYNVVYGDLSALSEAVVFRCEPYQYYAGDIIVPLTESVLERAFELLSYIRFDYPVLDDSDYSERQWEDAQDQWLSWGQSDSYSEVSEYFEDEMDTLRSTPEGSDIADDIDRAGQLGFVSRGLGDDLSADLAAEAMSAQCQAWHALYRWRIETCDGNQITLGI